MNIDDAIDQLKETKIRIENLRLDIAKNLVSVSCAILAILIALSGEKHHNNLLVDIAFLSFLLCILFGLSLLKTSLSQLRRMDKDWQELIKVSFLNSVYDRRLAVFSKYDNLLSFCEWACMLSFVVGFLLLVIHWFFG